MSKLRIVGELEVPNEVALVMVKKYAEDGMTFKVHLNAQKDKFTTFDIGVPTVISIVE